MLRRDFLASAVLPFLPVASRLQRNIIFGGWLGTNNRRFLARYKRPYFSQWDERIKGTGTGKVIMLHPFLEKMKGHPLIPRKQGEVGTCVGVSFASGVDILTATQALMMGKPERFIADAASEIIYAGSRVECGAGPNQRGDGSVGSWAADWLMKYGVILRQVYGNYDFTVYDPKKARSLGRTGCPDDLEEVAKEHPVRTAALVRSYQEVIDAIANGYPVAMCSDLGFGSSDRYWVRDSEGFLKRTPWDPWMHAMLLIGFDDAYSRKGVCCWNSWGDVHSGPKRHNQPDGSFWIEKKDIEYGMKSEDSYALSCYVGYPRVDVPSNIFW